VSKFLITNSSSRCIEKLNTFVNTCTTKEPEKTRKQLTMGGEIARRNGNHS